MNAMPWVLAGLAVAAAVYRVVLVLARSVSHDALGAVLERLFRAGDLARARKLLSAIPGVPVAVAMDAVVVHAGELPERSDELVVRAALEKTFARAFADATTTIGPSQFLSTLALMFAAGAVGVGFQLGQPAPAILVAAAIAVVLVVYAATTAHRIKTRGPQVFERTLPSLLERVCAPAGTYRAPRPNEGAKTAPVPSTEVRPKKDVVFVDVLHAGVETRHLELAQPVIKIGTHTEAHVSIEPEKGVGRMHAVIERTDEGAQIIDLGNQAGTLVGGAKITRTKLQQGDEVVIGTTTLRIGLGLPPTYLELEPVDGDDPKTWDPPAMFLYGFNTRAPDLFYELVDEIVRASPAAKGIRLAKLRRPKGDPSFVVALLGEEAAVKVARAAIEQQAEARYARFVTPVSEIAPDATYGRETATSARVREELQAGELQVMVSAVV